MPFVLVKIILLLALLCGTVVIGSAPVRVTLSPLTKAAYSQAEKSQITTKPRVTFPLKKQGSRIIIPTTKGSKVFKDVVITETFIKQGHSEDEATTYTYLGFLPDFKYHLLKVGFYETEAWLLVDSSGKSFELWGAPLFSPDMKRIAAICQGIEYGGGQPNIIQMLELQNGTLREIWTLRPKTWEPMILFWTSNNTLYLRKQLCEGDGYYYPKRFAYARLSVR